MRSGQEVITIKRENEREDIEREERRSNSAKYEDEENTPER